MENNEEKVVISSKAAKKAKEHNLPEEFIDIEFQVPTDMVNLPSGGIFYPEQGYQKTVEVKYLTAEEDDVLYSPELLKSGKVLDALLQVAVRLIF